MKYLVAVVQTHKLEDVRDALLELGIDELTVAEVKRFGVHAEHKEIYRAAIYDVGYMPRTKIEFAVSDELVEKAVQSLRGAAHTEDPADGKIYVLELSHAVQIHCGAVDADVATL